MSRTLTSILSIVIAILLYIFVIDQQLAQMSAVQIEIGEYQKAEEKYTEFQKKLDSLVAIKKQASVIENEKLDALVPEVVDDVKLIVDLENMAKSRGMLFGNISIDNAKDESSINSSTEIAIGPTLKSTDISFAVIGTYEQFKQLLEDIEKSLVLLEVVELDFSVTQGVYQQYAVTVRAYAFSQ